MKRHSVNACTYVSNKHKLSFESFRFYLFAICYNLRNLQWYAQSLTLQPSFRVLRSMVQCFSKQKPRSSVQMWEVRFPL